MKKLIASFATLILIAFIFSSCTEKEQSSANPTAAENKQETFSTNVICGDQMFPEYTWPSTESHCGCGSYINNLYPNQMIANMWSQHVSAYNGQLGSAACDPYSTGVKAPASISALQSGNNPKVQWGFVYSHLYVIEKKVGAGAWNVLATINNLGIYPSYPYYTQQVPYYVDASVNLSNPHEAIYYRVYAKNYGTLSAASPEASYAALTALSATINGMGIACAPEAGGAPLTYTWSANITGGVAPYTYQWSATGYPSGTASTYSITVADNVTRIKTFTLTLTVTDAVGHTSTTSRSIKIYPYETCPI